MHFRAGFFLLCIPFMLLFFATQMGLYEAHSLSFLGLDKFSLDHMGDAEVYV